MTQLNPLVSVIISNKNQEKFIFESLKSIFNQSFKNYEFIITDDCSNDDSLAIIKKFDFKKNLKIIENKKTLGLTKNLINMINISKGKYICRHDSDDISHKDRIKILVNQIQKDNKLILVGSSPIIIDENNNYIKKKVTSFYITSKKSFKKGNIVTHGSVLFEKNSYFQSGGYDSNFVYSQDFDLWLRLIDLGNFIILKEGLYSLRVHNQSISSIYKDDQNIFSILAYIKNIINDHKFFKFFLDNFNKNKKSSYLILINYINNNLNNINQFNILLSLYKKNDIDFLKKILKTSFNLKLKILFFIVCNKYVYRIIKIIYNIFMNNDFKILLRNIFLIK